MNNTGSFVMGLSFGALFMLLFGAYVASCLETQHNVERLELGYAKVDVVIEKNGSTTSTINWRTHEEVIEHINKQKDTE